MAWTAKQQEAIDAAGMNILVAAAAGSGKTSVLVERIINKLLAPKGAVNIDELLVVTFTRAAAGEMRERIAAALNARLAENPLSKNLERQLILLNGASISTFDSFCQSVVKKNFHLTDIDPTFRIASEQELALLQRDVIEELFEENYSKGEDSFLNFVEAIANERGDEGLYQMILSLHRFAESQPQPLLWLKNLAAPFDLAGKASFAAAKWVDIVLMRCKLTAGEGAAIYQNMLSLAAAEGFDHRLPLYKEEFALIKNFQEKIESFSPDQAGWEALQKAVFAITFSRMKSAPKNSNLDEGVKNYLDSLRNKFKSDIKNLTESYFISSHAEIMEDIKRALPYVDELCRLTLEFSRAYQKAKRKKNIADFSDIAHFCLKILCRDYTDDLLPSQMQPSDAAIELCRKYKEIMCDEYQDTNSLQETILKLVSRGDNLFVVGDVKQSIYRFRSADSALFLEKYNTYKDGGAANRRILLAQNFRSRKNILDGINFVFFQLMSPKIVELAYGDDEMLNAGREILGGDLTDTIELDIIDTENSGESEEEGEISGLEIEAMHIAKKINELLMKETKIDDKGELRKLEYRDIVILLRAAEGKAEQISDVLKKNNIPAYAPSGSTYFQSLEIRTMLAVLAIIDNPLQDVPLAAVLCSPIGGLSAENAAAVRLAKKGGYLWDAVNAYINENVYINGNDAAKENADALGEKLAAFKKMLAEWREFVKENSVALLIRKIFKDTCYYEYVGGMAGGLLRQANLRMLYERAIEYEETDYRGLFRFLRFIDRMRRMQTDLAAARTLGENENVVRIMSIHKSKGLEFPVVILADTAKKFNYMDAYANFLISKEYGLGAKAYDSALEYSYPTAIYRAISDKLKLEIKAEELRILYVAMTRAKEKLIITGRAGLGEINSWQNALYAENILLDDYLIVGADSYLTCLGLALMRHSCGKKLLEYGGCAAAEKILSDQSRWEINIFDENGNAIEDAPDGEDIKDFIGRGEKFAAVSVPAAKEIEKLFNYPYDDRALMEVPSKLSVTEMKRRFAMLQDGATVFKETKISRRPSFVQKIKKLTGSEYGTIIHSVMQYADYAADLSPQGIAEQLEQMVAEEKLTREQKNVVDSIKVSRFFQSDLGRRLLAADRIWREMPFSILVRANEFYPSVKDEEKIFIQGIVDVLFEENGELVLVDYKTDRTGTKKSLLDKYSLQINVYARAIQQIMGRTIKEKYLYLFQQGEAVPVEE